MCVCVCCFAKSERIRNGMRQVGVFQKNKKELGKEGLSLRDPNGSCHEKACRRKSSPNWQGRGFISRSMFRLPRVHPTPTV